jgi:transposase, IS5 family
MLRDSYAEDKLFANIIQLMPPMDFELAAIDQYLEDEELFQLIRADFSKRWQNSLLTGRNSTPVEVVLRMLVVKRLYQYSYADTVRMVNDSLTLRQFCRLYLNAAPDDKTIMRWNNLLQPETLEQFNARITELAVKHKVTKGKCLRTDGTVVAGNTLRDPPSDSRQLADSVRVLERTVQRARHLSQALRTAVKETGTKLTRQTRDLARSIGQNAKKKTEAAKEAGQQLYRALVDQTQAVIQQARQVLPQLKKMKDKYAQRLVSVFENFTPLAEQVIDQTERRVFQHEQVPAQEKIVSIFEPHTDIICCGKETKPVEYGHKIWLAEVDGGIVCHYRILDGNPPDAQQWQPSLKAHKQLFHHPPQQASTDRGVYSPDNQTFAQKMGVQRVILPKPGYKSQSRKTLESRKWFVTGRKWHAGVEGRISVLKRAHGLEYCLDHGENGFHRWVGWGIIAGNLAVMGRAA